VLDAAWIADHLDVPWRFVEFDKAGGVEDGAFDRAALEAFVQSYRDGNLEIDYFDLAAAMALRSQPETFDQIDGALGVRDGWISTADIAAYVKAHPLPDENE
jgi:hypothetical protein